MSVKALPVRPPPPSCHDHSKVACMQGGRTMIVGRSIGAGICLSDTLELRPMQLGRQTPATSWGPGDDIPGAEVGGMEHLARQQRQQQQEHLHQLAVLRSAWRAPPPSSAASINKGPTKESQKSARSHSNSCAVTQQTHRRTSLHLKVLFSSRL